MQTPGRQTGKQKAKKIQEKEETQNVQEQNQEQNWTKCRKGRQKLWQTDNQTQDPNQGRVY